MLPATQQRWHSCLYPSGSQYWIKQPQRDAKLSWPSWPVTYRDGIPTRRQSSIPVLTRPDMRRMLITTVPRHQLMETVTMCQGQLQSICFQGLLDMSTVHVVSTWWHGIPMRTSSKKDLCAVSIDHGSAQVLYQKCPLTWRHWDHDHAHDHQMHRDTYRPHYMCYVLR